ncbi:hypothetical membrane protein [Glutamicibacter arilaitensis Re117]|uniref:Hypothetical membrane protein n=1 Tax=Glutamicibacter arilaitensis (strain DSM 16368 / CIP 108037 / IAM 15318 / JCM 13566 / NCIMB 14258 / Re117) TaxID=861360 RepID=A0ABP1U795_GLUAR|nr:hypothetical membrane protein [Glutamicibacter arilaitensis Re117]
MNMPPNDTQIASTNSIPKIWPFSTLMKHNPIMGVFLVAALITIAVLLVKLWSLANGGMLILAGSCIASFVFILVGAFNPRRAKG